MVTVIKFSLNFNTFKRKDQKEGKSKQSPLTSHTKRNKINVEQETKKETIKFSAHVSNVINIILASYQKPITIILFYSLFSTIHLFLSRFRVHTHFALIKIFALLQWNNSRDGVDECE